MNERSYSRQRTAGGLADSRNAAAPVRSWRDPLHAACPAGCAAVIRCVPAAFRLWRRQPWITLPMRTHPVTVSGRSARHARCCGGGCRRCTAVRGGL